MNLIKKSLLKQGINYKSFANFSLSKGINFIYLNQKNTVIFEKFFNEEQIISSVDSILNLQKSIMSNLKIRENIF
jgi:hypothetical protein